MEIHRLLARNASVYMTQSGDIIVTYDPVEDASVPEDEAHNCDLMGCGWEHVLLRTSNYSVDLYAVRVAKTVE